jgi:hypothetical protein
MNHNCASESGKAGQHPQETPDVGDVQGHERQDDLRYESDGSLRRGHKGSLALRVSEARDDERIEVGDPGVGNRLSQHEDPVPGQPSDRTLR